MSRSTRLSIFALAMVAGIFSFLHFTEYGCYLTWRCGVGVIDSTILLDCNGNWEDLPDIVGSPIDRVRLTDVVPDRAHAGETYDLQRICPGCDRFYWLGRSQVLIGVKDGVVVRTTELKG